MTIDEIINTISNPLEKSVIETKYYKDNNVLEVMDKNFKTVMTVNYNFDTRTYSTNYAQYSTIFAKFIILDKQKFNLEGDYLIHTSRAALDDTTFFRSSFGEEFESSFFQFLMISNINGNDISNINKMVKMVPAVLTSTLQRAKIEFHNFNSIEI